MHEKELFQFNMPHLSNRNILNVKMVDPQQIKESFVVFTKSMDIQM